jgi:hypothetical protein
MGRIRTVERHDWVCMRFFEEMDWIFVEDLNGSHVEDLLMEGGKE